MQQLFFTQRLCIRPIQLTDQALLSQFLCEPANCLLLGCDPFHPAQANDRTLALSALHQAGIGYHWVIERRDLRIPIGFCDAYPPPSHLASLQYADISYGLDPLYRGQGYMQEALAACLGHLINVAQFKRIEATVNPENTASYKLLESLGFKSEGIQRQKGVWGSQRHDMLGYALLAGELIAPPA